MRLGDKAEFTKLLVSVGGLYQQTINEEVAELYWNTLKSYVLKDITAAIACYMEQGQTMPTPADICRYFLQIAQATVQTAWGKVARATKHVGSYKSVVFDDALIHCVIDDMGGWEKICGITNEELPEHVKEFEEHYIRYLNEPPKTYPRILKGFIDLSNETNGYAHRAPIVLIGDKHKAHTVMKKGGDVSNPPQFYVMTREVLPLQNSAEQSTPLSLTCEPSSATETHVLVSYNSLLEDSQKAHVG